MALSSEDDDIARVVHKSSKSSSESEKVNCSLVTHSTFLISAGIEPFLHEKWMDISSRHNGRLSSFLLATARGHARRSKCSIFDSLFYSEKEPFSCMC